MIDLRSSRNLIKRLHRHEKATIDHVARNTGPATVDSPTTHPAFTDCGLAVEDQIRKSWGSASTGLPIF